MSYILDALRRADAERERDPARGIHAQPGAVLPRDAGRRRAPWIVAVAAVLAIGAAGFYLAQREPERTANAPALPAAAPEQSAAPAPQAAPAAPVVAATPAIVPVANAVLPPAPPSPAPAPVLAQAPAPAGPSAGGERGTRRAPPPPMPATTTAPPAAAVPAPAPASASVVAAPPAASASQAPAAAARPLPPAPDRIVAVAELPPDILRELPKLVIAGGVHSDNPAQRMLIVGGQVRTEGAELAPGLVLEQIRNGSAVLRFRGWRYSVSY